MLAEPRDRRCTGRSAEVVAGVLADPTLFADVVAAMDDDDELVRMRTADAAEKITRSRPDLLVPHARPLLALAAGARQQELRWHLASMLPRLRLDDPERRRAWNC